MLWLIFGIQFGYAESGITDPVFVVEKAKPSASTWGIDRIVGCTGDLETARGNVQGSEGVLVEPKYNTSSYTKGVFAMTDPTCVVGDPPTSKDVFNDYVADFDGYLYDLFECECGSCYVSDPTAEYGLGDSFPDGDWEEYVTEEHKKSFATYKENRAKELAVSKVQHELYSSDYDAWMQKFETKLHDESIRISLTPETDLADAVLTIYSFTWEHHLWCGETQEFGRSAVDHREIQLPTLAKDQTLHIWLHGVDSQLTWGAVLNQGDSTESIVQKLEADPIQSLKTDATSSDVYSLPSSWKGRAIQLPPGTGSNISNTCCSC